MIICAIVADDLTGANATGVLLTKQNYRTYTITGAENFDKRVLSDCDCVVFPTDSRSIEPADAYTRVSSAVGLLKTGSVKVYTKRIDTTLRGNLGAETDAMLDTLGDDRIAMIVPCFPSSGRINVGGYLLVQGVPLHKTAVAQDPKTPVFTPLCADLFREQSKYPAASIFIADLMKGEDFVAEKIRSLTAGGIRNIIFDSISGDDIDLAANAVIKSGAAFIAVDPGPFTASLCKRLAPPGSRAENPSSPKRILVAVGSVNAVARKQVDVFLAAGESYNVFVDTAELLESGERRAKEISRVIQEIDGKCGAYTVCGVIGRGIMPEHRVSFEPYIEKNNCSIEDLSNRINTGIAEICRGILDLDKGFQGMYTCGGDITIAVCAQLRNVGLQLLGEVLPLASYSEIAGGDYDGLKMVTKGGMVGEPDAIVACVKYLKEKLGI
ncbi:MAG: four-carbon acid sugar kinase family protein [Treponema sp.]|jgi:uncharacterized protein YgbK (DUF1537 family)|nr:four-carbon acid sugar kinase family protein [Treponema sp.]